MPVDVRDDAEAAGHLSLGECPCGCGSLQVRLHDREDRIFAVGSMSPEIADDLAKAIGIYVERMKAGGLAAIACQGTA